MRRKSASVAVIGALLVGVLGAGWRSCSREPVAERAPSGAPSAHPPLRAGRVVAQRDAPPASPAEGASEIPPPAPSGLIALVVRDLADGSPCPGFAVRFGEPGTHVAGDRRSDASGAVAVAEAEFARGIAQVDPPFRAVGRTGTASIAPTLWVCRDLVIDGTLLFDPGVPAEKVEVSAVIEPGMAGVTAGRVEPPWSRQWLEASGIALRRKLARLGADGRFELTMPRVRGLVLLVTGPRDVIAPVARRLDVGSAVDRTQQDVRIAQVRTISGRVIFPDGGQTVAGREARVILATDRLGRTSETDVGLLHVGSGQAVGMAGIGGADPEVVELSFRATAMRRRDGTFVVPCIEDGEHRLLVSAPDCEPEEIALGRVVGSLSGVEIRLRPRGGRTSLRVMDGATPVAGGSVTFIDHSQLDGPTTLGPFTIDAEGHVAGVALTEGRDYRITIQRAASAQSSPGVTGWMTWRGLRTVDVSVDLRPDRSK